MTNKTAIIISLGVVLASLVLGVFFFSARSGGDRSLRVVGMAAKKINSDTVKWNIIISRTASISQLKEAYALMQNDLEKLTSYLKEKNRDAENITIQPVNSNPNYSQNGVNSYTLQQRIVVVSHNLDNIEKQALNPRELYQMGIIINSSNLDYYVADLTETKMELLAGAAKDARKRATEIAKSSGIKIGRLVSARAGVFQVREPYSTEVSDYGILNTATRQKEATVTLSAGFQID